MDWLQVLTLFFANAGLIIWVRSESRNDWSDMNVKMDENLKAIHDEIFSWKASRFFRKEDDVISILCKLKCSCDEFPTMQTSFLYEFGDREYEIKFDRDAGRVVKFHITDIGLSREGQKVLQEELEVVNENN